MIRGALLFAILLILSCLLGFEPQQRSISQSQKAQDQQRTIDTKISQRYRGIGDLRSLAAKSSGDVEVLAGISQKIYFPGNRELTVQDFVRHLARAADAIVIGTVIDQKAYLTTEGTFVFTDSSVSVERILKGHTGALVYPSSIVIVTRPGGAIDLNGHRVRAYDEALQPLELGKTYLLFLAHVPNSEGYAAFEPGAAFRIEGQLVVTMTREQMPKDLQHMKLSAMSTYIRSGLP